MSETRRPRCARPLAILLWIVCAASCAAGSSVLASGSEPEPTASSVSGPRDATGVVSPADAADAVETPAVPSFATEDSAHLGEHQRVVEVPEPTPNLLADMAVPIDGAAVGFPTVEERPQPVGIRIESIAIDNAEIIDVGVDAVGDFEVPPADQVGWYRFGPEPGADTGSAVLAAHIAFDGVDGVFRHLVDLEPGAVLSVDYDDGSTAWFMVDDVTEYVKEALPDSLFARDGDAQLVLITCGGDFNRQLRSYESNVVAVATRIEPPGDHAAL